MVQAMVLATLTADLLSSVYQETPSLKQPGCVSQVIPKVVKFLAELSPTVDALIKKLV